MSYIGNEPTSVAFLTDTFSGNGSTTAFTLSAAPAGTSSILVAITGVVQDPSTYSVVGTTLTFSPAPPAGTGNISVRFLGIPASGVTTTAYRTVTEFTATAGQTTFSVPSYTVGFIDVYRNGVMLGSADYTASNGVSVVLASGATAGDLVEVISMQVSSVLNAIPATAGSVSASNLASGSVTSAKIASGQTFALNGVQFPATQVPSADANTLDDYEEGTWTPVFFAGGIAGTSLAYTGTYTKIGRVVTVNFVATSTTNSSNVVIASYAGFSGLPFSVSSSGGSGAVTTEDIDIFDRNGFCQVGTTYLFLSKSGAASGTNSIYASCTYFTS